MGRLDVFLDELPKLDLIAFEKNRRGMDDRVELVVLHQERIDLGHFVAVGAGFQIDTIVINVFVESFEDALVVVGLNRRMPMVLDDRAVSVREDIVMKIGSFGFAPLLELDADEGVFPGWVAAIDDKINALARGRELVFDGHIDVSINFLVREDVLG